MPVFGPPPVTAAELARKIASDSDPSWDWGDRPIKNLLFRMGCDHGLAFCRKKGLPEGVDVQEWLLDLVWMDKTTLAIGLAVESELSLGMRQRLDDFQKLMSTKSPLKLFIYATRNAAESDNVRDAITQYLRNFSQHIEGEEYLLMDVTRGHPMFYHFRAPNSGSVGMSRLPRYSSARVQAHD
jgi:hypothetical protein